MTVTSFRLITAVPRMRAFLRRLRDDRMAAFAAQSAFFSLLALVPFTLLLLSAAAFGFPEAALDLSGDLLPLPLASLLASAWEESGALTPISALTALWAASRAVAAVIGGLNGIERKEETRAYWRLRLAAAVYTVVFLLLLLSALLLLLLGGGADLLLKKMFPAARWLVLVDLRGLSALILLTGLFLLIYRYLPSGKARYPFRSFLPGAVFASLAWQLLSAFFSFSAVRITDYSRLYGTLAAVALVMLWLYACMLSLFLGAEINVALRGDKT